LRAVSAISGVVVPILTRRGFVLGLGKLRDEKKNRAIALLAARSRMRDEKANIARKRVNQRPGTIIHPPDFYCPTIVTS
jgi:hypothetical protein